MTIKKASSVVDDVIQQLQHLNTENIEKNMLCKTGLHPNRNGKEWQFAKNLMVLFEHYERYETIL